MFNVQWNNEAGDCGTVILDVEDQEDAIKLADRYHADHEDANAYVTTTEPDANGIDGGTIYETGIE